MQAGTGAAEGGTVRPVDDGFAYPETAEVIRVTVTPTPASGGSNS